MYVAVRKSGMPHLVLGTLHRERRARRCHLTTTNIHIKQHEQRTRHIHSIDLRPVRRRARRARIQRR
jgi:hypothetical protein